MNYMLIIIGIITSFFGYIWDFHYAVHPTYHRLKGRSDTTQLVLQTISNVLFFGGYGLIIFSSGLDGYKMLINIVIVATLHIIIFPFISKIIYIPKNNEIWRDMRNNLT